MEQQIPMDESPEFEDDLEFQQALVLVRSRLEEAQQLTQEGFALSLRGSHPETLDPIAVYVLAESYERMLSGVSEQISIAVPIETMDFRRAVPATDAGHDYFVVGKPGDYEQQVTVSRDNYASLFQSSEPLIENFLQKLWTYELVPALKHF